MKLSAKQIAALDQSEFGIPETKSYPMPDKEHVLLAIRFFKFCPKGKEKELAGNINRLAKKYNLKCHIHGSFLKYADKEIIDLAKEAIDVEAYNFGQIEPIVGAGSVLSKIPIPDINTKNVPDSFKALGLFASGKINRNVEDIDEDIPRVSYSISEESSASWLYGYLQEYDKNHPDKKETDTFYVPSEQFKEFENMISKSIADIEIKSASKYMSANYDSLDNFKHSLTKVNYGFIKIISDIIDEYDNNIDTIVSNVTKIVSGIENKDHLFICMAWLYRCREIPDLFERVITRLLDNENNSLSILSCLSVFKNSVLNITTYSNDTVIDINKHENFRFDELEKIDDTFNDNTNTCVLYGLVQYSIGLSLRKDNFNTYYPQYDYILFAAKYLLRRGDISAYYYCKFADTLFVKFPNNTLIYYGAFIKNIDASVDIVFVAVIGDEMLDKEIDKTLFTRGEYKPNLPTVVIRLFEGTEVTTESMSSTGKKLKRLLKSLRINKKGDVSINLKDKLTFDHYNEIHRVLMTEKETNDIAGMKYNVAYLFSIIATIDREYTYSKSIDKNSSEYSEMLRLRALFISDFKVFMRIIIKSEPGFVFMDYYKKSKMDDSVYTLKHSTLKGLSVLFKTIMTI